MEEIDIIELLKRVKEGKAPKRIQIGIEEYEWDKEYGCYYRNVYDSTMKSSLLHVYSMVTLLNTKIKILDKPIIEELKVEEGHTDLSGLPYTVYPTKDEIIEKINEIIKHINEGEK